MCRNDDADADDVCDRVGCWSVSCVTLSIIQSAVVSQQHEVSNARLSVQSLTSDLMTCHSLACQFVGHVISLCLHHLHC